MGLLNLPSPVLTWMDGWLTSFLPPLAKLLLWAVVGALVSMELYRLLSPQRKLAALKLLLQRAQRRVAQHDGEINDAWPLIGRMLSLAVRRLALLFPATVLASLPLLIFIVWLDNAYGSAFPSPGEAVQVKVSGNYQALWIEGEGGKPPRAKVIDSNGDDVLDVFLTAPAAVVHKWQWWSVLLGNPAGYLPADAPIDKIDISVPRQQFVSVGPDWLRGWEAIYFPALVLFALAFKLAWRIE